MYYNERRGERDGWEPISKALNMAIAPFRVLVPSVAEAVVMNDERRSFNGSLFIRRNIQRGERTLFTETFQGNGRTCGTCHPIDASFTLSVKEIQTLRRRRRNNPLFVAENIRELAGLERPELMRNFGLILENVDGFEEPTNKLTMRSIPHVLSLATSIGPKAGGGFPSDLTGWSGDGAPDGNGSLKQFLLGAIRQHYPRTLNRCFRGSQEGESGANCRNRRPDFRMATQSELNNVEAFLLALGRPMDPDISSMDLTDSQANQDLQIFSNGPCNTCHGNAGAINAFGVNGLIDTGVENDPAARRRRARFDIPRDGGFGAGDGTEDIGDGRFNVPPVIEAADTPPFFHNSARLRSIEEAVRFYSTAAFNNSPGADLAG